MYNNTIEAEIEIDEKVYKIKLERSSFYPFKYNPREVVKKNETYDYQEAVEDDCEEYIFNEIEQDPSLLEDIYWTQERKQEDFTSECQQNSYYFHNATDAQLALAGNYNLVEDAKNELGMESTDPRDQDQNIRYLLADRAVSTILDSIQFDMQEQIEEQDKAKTQNTEENNNGKE